MRRTHTRAPGGPTVAIVGAGFGGIAMAVNLKKAGFNNFVVYERAAGPGGTWYHNTYPGCEVDINSQLYSFSFMPFDWSRTHCGQEELQAYAEATIDHFGIRRNFQFSTGVAEAVWDEPGSQYQVTLDSGEQRRFDLLVTSVGLFNAPKFPDWPGLAEFEGDVLHSARWDPKVELSGKTVALVGTGSSSVQIVPELASTVEHLYVFQREACWVLPKNREIYQDDVRDKHRRRPGLQKLTRFKTWAMYEMMLRNAWTAGSRQNLRLEKIARAYLADQVGDPELRRAVTPTHPFACKRPLFTDTFYAALQRDNVTLVPHAVTGLSADAVIAADGVKREVDALVTATGFQTQRFLANLDVVGLGGKELHKVWDGSPEAFFGITVPGFPNFFMIYGPNTNGGSSIILMLERQAEAIARAASRLRASGASAIDTRLDAHRRYIRWLDRENERRWTAARYCNNYYFSKTGRNVTQWPRSSMHYRLALRALFRAGTFTRTSAKQHLTETQ